MIVQSGPTQSTRRLHMEMHTTKMPSPLSPRRTGLHGRRCESAPCAISSAGAGATTPAVGAGPRVRPCRQIRLRHCSVTASCARRAKARGTVTTRFGWPAPRADPIDDSPSTPTTDDWRCVPAKPQAPENAIGKRAARIAGAMPPMMPSAMARPRPSRINSGVAGTQRPTRAQRPGAASMRCSR